MHSEQKVWSNWSLGRQNYLNYPKFTEHFVITWLFSAHVLLCGPFFVGPLFGRTCWTCLNPPLADLYIKFGSVCPSVPRSQRALTLYPPTECAAATDRCQRSLAVKPLNSRPAMYFALQLLGVRDDSWLSETSLTATARGGAGVGLWTLTRMCTITETDATTNRSKFQLR